MDSEGQTPDQLPPCAAQRLGEMIAAETVFCYVNQAPNKEHRYIKCSIYGATVTNELFVKLENDTVSFVEAVSSMLYHPPMRDRIFGMDVLDEHCSLNLAEKMWIHYNQQLICKVSTRG